MNEIVYNNYDLVAFEQDGEPDARSWWIRL